jgi:hypothetical protein
MTSATMNILVAGSLAAAPTRGGRTWAVLQVLLGLKRLGHEVYYVDVIDPLLLSEDGEFSPAAMTFRAVMADFEFRRHATMLLRGRHEAAGAMSYSELTDLARRMDLLINVGGALQDHPLLLRLRRRLFLDLDPGFTQLRAAVADAHRASDAHAAADPHRPAGAFAGHTHHATTGPGIGRGDCPIPTGGVRWITTPQPVVLDRWPVADDPPAHDGLTTVAEFHRDAPIERGGIVYASEGRSLRALASLPARTGQKFRVALAADELDAAAELEPLRDNQWRLLDRAQVAASPQAFRQFVQGSRAALVPAPGGFARAHLGSLDHFAVCALACGRPVVAQETGFGAFLPAGEGLLSFTDESGAVRAIAALDADPARHRRAARAIAERYFDSDKVLGELLGKVAS